MRIFSNFLLPTVVLGAAFSAQAANIGPDRGGQLKEYLRHRAQLEASGERVVIDKICASACLVYTSLPNSCVTPSTTLMLHAGQHATRLGSVLYAARLPEGMSNYWVSNFANRPRSNSVHHIRAGTAARIGWEIRLCKQG